VARDDTGWNLLVFAADAVRADTALVADDRENAERVPPPEAPPYPWTSGVTVALLLLAVFSMTGPPGAGSRWFAASVLSAKERTYTCAWRDHPQLPRDRRRTR